MRLSKKSFFYVAVVLPLLLCVSCQNEPVADGFVKVEGGTFKMGNKSEVLSTPVHTVKVDTFYMMQTEVTQKLYMQVMGKNPSYFQPEVQKKFETVAENEIQEMRPVECVSWYEALVFCNKMSVMHGLKPCYSIDGKTDLVTDGTAPRAEDAKWTGVVCNWKANGYRLPTEAEWEFAARGGVNQQPFWYAGGSTIDDFAWYRDNAGYKTHEVAKKQPNTLGLYDMSGNVFELCWDWLHSYVDNRLDNPSGPYPGTKHVERGGSWDHSPDNSTVTIRYFDEPYMKNERVGFRVVRR